MVRLKKDDAFGYVLERVNPYGEQPERRNFERSWFISTALFAGQPHLVELDGTLRAPVNMDRNRELHSANLILPKVERSVAKLLQLRADMGVAPNTGHPADRHAAKIAEKVWEHLKLQTGYRAKLTATLLDAAIMGSGFMKITWNPVKGRASRVYWRSKDDHSPDPAAFMDHRVRREKERQDLFEDTFPGDVDIENPSPFQIFPDPAAKSDGIAACRWLCQIHAVPVSDIEDRWGIPAESIPRDESYRGGEIYEETISNLVSASVPASGYGHQPQSTKGHRARVIEFFERPNRKNKWEGRYILIAGETVIRSERNPYVASGSPIPFVKIDWFTLRGRFWGLGLVEQLREPQRAYNRSRSTQREFEKNQGHAPIIVQKGTGIKTVNLSNHPGVIIEAPSPQSAPTFGHVPQMPEYIARNSDRARQEMDDISAQSDPTSGRTPGQMRSGAAMRQYMADNNLILTPISENVLAGTAEAGTMCLQLWSLFADDARTVRVIGRSGEYDIEAFRGSDLRSHTQIQLFGQPGQALEAEQVKEDLYSFLETGVINPNHPQRGEEDRDLILSTFNFHTVDEIYQAKLQQQGHEESELKEIMRPGSIYDPAVYPWYDAAIRGRVIERFMNSQDFRGMAEEAQERVVRRWEQFGQMRAQDMQAQLQFQQLAQGGAAPKGTASQPRKTASA